jgi:hypothetical protein
VLFATERSKVSDPKVIRFLGGFGLGAATIPGKGGTIPEFVGFVLAASMSAYYLNRGYIFYIR